MGSTWWKVSTVYLSRVPKIFNIFFTESMCSENIADEDDDNIEVNYSVVPYESVPSTSTSNSKQNTQKNTKYDTPPPSSSPPLKKQKTSKLSEYPPGINSFLEIKVGFA
jgi:hypothetical protein